MTQPQLFALSLAAVILARLVLDAWRAWERRRLQRALDDLASVVETWDRETGYPKECVAEGLGEARLAPFAETKEPSPVTPDGELDPSTQAALAEIRRQRA